MIHPGLLRDILEHPHDNTPRLVLADWLEEHGDEARVTLIRVQIELEGAALGTGRARELATAEANLLEAHGKHWASEAAMALIPSEGVRPPRDPSGAFQGGSTMGQALAAVSEGTFRRGFVESISLPTAAFLEHGRALVLACPLLEIKLTDLPPGERDYGGGDERPAWFRGASAGPWEYGSIPLCLWDAMTGGSREHYFYEFRSRPEAQQTLSRACVAWARTQAGLPSLPPV